MPEDEKLYPALNAEDVDQALDELRRLSQEGMLQPQRQPSLIGVDPAQFVVEWPKQLLTTGTVAPPEFTGLAFNGLDAYATALLGLDLSFQKAKDLKLSCALKKHADSTIDICFTANSELSNLELDTQNIPKFLRVFVPALSSKSIKTGSIFCNRTKAEAWLAYPGQMKLQYSSLAGLSEDLWPILTGTILLSETLQSSARLAARLLTASMEV